MKQTDSRLLWGWKKGKMSVFSMDADFCISLVLLKFNLHTDMSAFVVGSYTLKLTLSHGFRGLI